MFDFFARTPITMALLFLLIVPSFVLFGVDRYQRAAPKGEQVAAVDGDGHHATRMGSAASQRSRSHPAAIAQRRPGAARQRRCALCHARAHGARPCAGNSLPPKGNMTRVGRQAHRHLRAGQEGLATFRGADGKFDREGCSSAPPATDAGAVRSPAIRTAARDAAGAPRAYRVHVLCHKGPGRCHDERLLRPTRRSRSRVSSRPTSAGKVQRQPMPSWTPTTRTMRHCSRHPSRRPSSTSCSAWDLVKKNISVNEADVKTYYEQNKSALR